MRDLNSKKQNDGSIIENTGALTYYLRHERNISKYNPKAKTLKR